MAKACTRCKTEQPLANFSRKGSLEGGFPWCRACVKVTNKERRAKNLEQARASDRAYHAANREKRNAYCKEYRTNNQEYFITRRADPEYKKLQKRSWYRKQYGTTFEDIERQLIVQEGRCAICRLPMDKWQLDHCHKTMKLRGLTHGNCNKMEGLLPPQITHSTMTKYREEGVWGVPFEQWDSTLGPLEAIQTSTHPDVYLQWVNGDEKQAETPILHAESADS